MQGMRIWKTLEMERKFWKKSRNWKKQKLKCKIYKIFFVKNDIIKFNFKKIANSLIICYEHENLWSHCPHFYTSAS